MTSDLMFTETYRELRKVIARLELVSHAPTQRLEPAEADPEKRLRADTADPAGVSRLSDKGGRRPPGGIEDDGPRKWQNGPPDDVVLRSAEHFRRRLVGCNTEADMKKVLADAQRALLSWQKTPPNSNPEVGSFQWKKQIVREVQEGKRSRESAREFYRISERTLRRYIHDYGEPKRTKRAA